MTFEGRIEPRELKRRLAEQFRHAFRVYRDRGTASHWINVRWEDGPTERDVRGFLAAYNDNGRDDIMTDLWCGSQYTTTDRGYSPAAFYWAAAEVEREFGVRVKVTDTISRFTGARSIYIKHEDDEIITGRNLCPPEYYISCQINRRLAVTDFRAVQLPPAPPAPEARPARAEP